MIVPTWDRVFSERSDCWAHPWDSWDPWEVHTRGEPLGKQVELLRVEGVSDRKGSDSSFVTQRIGQIHGGTQTVWYKYTPTEAATFTDKPHRYSERRLKCSGRCPDVREQHLYPVILVSTEGRTFLLHYPGRKSLEAALLAFVFLLTYFSPEEKRFFRLVSLGKELNMLNSAPSRASPSDLPAFRREAFLPVLWDRIAS